MPRLAGMDARGSESCATINSIPGTLVCFGRDMISRNASAFLDIASSRHLQALGEKRQFLTLTCVDLESMGDGTPLSRQRMSYRNVPRKCLTRGADEGAAYAIDRKRQRDDRPLGQKRDGQRCEVLSLDRRRVNFQWKPGSSVQVRLARH